MFGVVVNTYLTEAHPPSVKLSAQFAVALLRTCPEVSSIILVDGSEHPNEALERSCAQVGAQYVHVGRRLGFAEAYNTGAALLSEEWIALMASDIYVLPETFAGFRRFIEARADLPIGCLIPYLSQSDFPSQVGLPQQARTECRVPVMTLNLNVFRRQVYQDLGGLTETLSGNFNDVDLALRLKEKGFDTFLVDSFAHHYGSLTLRYGSNTSRLHDRDIFFVQRPHLRSPRGHWNLRLDRLLDHPALRIAYWLATSIPSDTVRAQGLQWVFDRLPRYQRLR